MATRRVRAPRIDFSDLRRELELPEQFPPAAQHEAQAAASARPPGVDRTDIPFVTIDPATSRDLDQAVHLSRHRGGYRVRYAIADVSSYVRPGGELETETWRRGQTVYLPDGNVPLHPVNLSEDAVSLLADRDRAAVLWTIDLDAEGATTAVGLERAVVRSRAKLDYLGVQADVDAGRAPEPIALLPEIGDLLVAHARARGAINLPLPELEVEPDDGGWRLVLRAPVPVEEYNAQISLLTGMSAAAIMLAGGVGLLRTMPAPRPEAVARLRAVAPALGVRWPRDATVGAVLAGVEPADPRGAAFVDQAAELLRGAGYTAFDGSPPANPGHSAVASAYAHVTAPLRRLADRYATEVCLALHEGRPVPGWAREALPKLPTVMAETDRVASAAERAAVDLTEAVLLSARVGEEFDAAVLDVDTRCATVGNGVRTGAPRTDAVAGGTVALDDPPVRARCTGPLQRGERVRVRLVEADPKLRRVGFELVER